jgi:hypothetical protein
MSNHDAACLCAAPLMMGAEVRLRCGDGRRRGLGGRCRRPTAARAVPAALAALAALAPPAAAHRHVRSGPGIFRDAAHRRAGARHREPTAHGCSHVADEAGAYGSPRPMRSPPRSSSPRRQIRRAESTRRTSRPSASRRTWTAIRTSRSSITRSPAIRGTRSTASSGATIRARASTRTSSRCSI